MGFRALLLLFGCSMLTAGVTQTGQVSKDPIAGYKAWTKVNDEPIYMEPVVAARCTKPAWFDNPDKNPHLPKYFTVYMNPIGKAAMLPAGKETKFPAGSVIVKEKYDGKDFSKPELLTVMIKHEPGFDKPNGDWEYMVVDGTDLSKRTGKNAQACQSCHNRLPDFDDYTFRKYVNWPYRPDGRVKTVGHG